MHIHYALFADILRDLAKTASALPADDEVHREALREAAGALYEALAADPDDVAGMTRRTRCCFSTRLNDDHRAYLIWIKAVVAKARIDCASCGNRSRPHRVTVILSLL